MKSIKTLLGTLLLAMFMLVMPMAVFAEDYDLVSLTVTDTDGNEIFLSPEFSSDVLTYKATAHYGTKKVKLFYETELEDAKVTTWNEALDPGDNQTFIKVTANGESQTYEVDIYVLTEEEEETYEESTDATSEDPTKITEDSLTADVDGETYYIVNSTSELDIPDGFEAGTFDYEGQTIAVIRHEESDLMAFCLTNEDGSDIDWFLYDVDNSDIYRLKNIAIKKRTYTIINYADANASLDNYDKEKITISDTEVEAWVLDDEQSFYLLYAMNWKGETNLYRYDALEENFQRYPESSLDSAILKEADESISELQTKYNELVSKYNKNNSLKWKIIAGLAIVIIILFFMCLNLILKIKDLTSEDYEYYDDDDEQSEVGYYEAIDFTAKNKTILQEKDAEAKADLAAGVAEAMEEAAKESVEEKKNDSSNNEDAEEADEDFEFID